MKPLLEIKTIPMSVEYKISNAKHERTPAKTSMEISREKNGLSISSKPMRVLIDTFEARNSITPTASRSIYQAADRGQSVAMESIAKFSQEGDMMTHIHMPDYEPIPEISNATNFEIAETVMRFIPEFPAEIDWTEADFSLEYAMDKLSFDWRTTPSDLEYTPADIEFVIKEYAQVIIEYTRGPMYVPPSSDPNYEPVDVKV